MMVGRVLLTSSPPGLYRLARGTGVLRARVEAAGWRWYEMDGTGVTNAPAFFDGIAAAMALPDYFGKNWDALLDCLRDLGDEDLPGCVVHLSGLAPFAAESPANWESAREVFAQAVADLKASGTALYVLVAGPAGRGLTALLPE
jgi:hypothetical protein